MTRHAQHNAIENADSGIVRIPSEAISRPLSEQSGEAFCTGFIAEQRLADLLFRRRIRRAGRGVITADGIVYDLYEGVRVVGPSHGQSDPYGLTGTVEHMTDLVRAGASLSAGSMHIGSASYQIVRGVIAVARDPMDADLVG